MKLYNIRKPENLFAKLDACKGNVDIVLSDGQRRDWREQGELVKALWNTMPDSKMDNVEVKLDDSDDTMQMIDFLMRGNC
ncbi:MAG: hypothetical protein RR893_12190, partial [Clostridia bacterium]